MSTSTVSSTKPWSTDDLIENASNWNLAGDANLLKYLESFSEDLLIKASKTNDNLNNLLDSLNSTSLSLDLVKNEFSSLHNNQFIESRVYEDDETIADKDDTSDDVEVPKPQTESEKAQNVQEAVMRGIEVVNKYFDKVDVPDSDSEEETDFPSFVLRPKDPYIDRPLPFVIGTDEWHTKWHVGLLDSSSESETEKVSDKFSDSDSDDDLPIKDRTQTENSYNAGSDVDLSSRLNLNRPVANSTFDDAVKRRDIFESSDSDEYDNSVPAQTPISNNTFAQELAAKLGNVIEQNPKIVSPEVNTKPIQPIKPTTIYANIFSEEPPPLDDEDEDDGLFGSSNEHDVLFSGRGALFDDLNDDSSNSWSKNLKPNKEQSSKPKPSTLFDDEGTDIFNNEAANFSTSKKGSGGLFDDDDAGYSDNDLFTDKPTISTKPLLHPYGPPTIPYFDDKPPEFEPVKSSKDVKTKKPVGGVKVLDVGDLFGKQTVGSLLKNRKQSSLSDDSADEDEPKIKPSPTSAKVDERVTKDEPKVSINKSFEQKEEKKIEEKEENVATKINPKQISLFDDDDEDDVDELFKDDLFSDISTKKFSSNLFDDDDFLKGDDVFSESFKSNDKFDSVSNPISENLNVTNETKDETVPSGIVDDNIFDLPPSIDDDWDVPSEDNLFEPSSIFSESSGIIRDGNYTTRIETDDSFNPNICSSRRFSYDTYNEEQSNDSLFTKNKPSVESQNGQYITSIPEVPEEAVTNSMIDITPSGNPDNLYSELDITRPADENTNSKKIESDLFKPDNPSSPSKIESNGNKMENVLFEPVNPISSSKLENNESADSKKMENDLFEPANLVSPSKIESNESADSKKMENDIFEPVNPISSSKILENSSKIFEKKETPKVALKPTVAKKPNSEEKIDTKSNEIKIGNPGKLKHNLNINVSALMPGVAPPRRKEVQTPNSPKRTPETGDNPFQIKSPTAVISTDQLDFSHKDLEPINSEKDPNLPEVLSSITKDRAKIAVKRRPSTRKARQESIRNSMTDFKLYLSPTEISDVEDDAEDKQNVLSSASPASSAVIPTNIFASPQESGIIPENLPGSPQKSAAVPKNLPESSQKSTVIPTKLPEGPKKSAVTSKIPSESSQKSTVIPTKLPEGPQKSAVTSTIPSESLQKSTVITTKLPDSSQKSAGEQKNSELDFEELFGDDDLFSNAISIEEDIFGESNKVQSNSLFGDSLESSTSLFGQKASDSKVGYGKEEENGRKASSTTTMVKQTPASITKTSSSSAKVSQVKKVSLFDDSEEFDDIFSTAKLRSKSTSLKKSLFDDDDDDDLFGPTGSSQKSDIRIESKVSEKKKGAPVKKLENTKVVDDPLSLFND